MSSDSFEEWGFPDNLKVTVVTKRGDVKDVLYNDRSLPPHAQGSLKIVHDSGSFGVSLTFIALDLEVVEAE